MTALPTGDEAATAAIRAGCNEMQALPCKYPNCICDWLPQILLAAVAAYTAKQARE